MPKQRHIFVVMAAGILALTGIFGPEIPELESEKEPEPIEEVIEQGASVGSSAKERTIDIAPEQYHIDLDIPSEDIVNKTVVSVGGGGKPGREIRYYWLSLFPVFGLSTFSSQSEETESHTELLRIEKRGDPVVWSYKGYSSEWHKDPAGKKMSGAETDLAKLQADLRDKLQLPSAQIDRLIAILMAGQPVMIGGNSSEDLPMLADYKKLHLDLAKVHAMSTENIGKIMAVVGGENPFAHEEAPPFTSMTTVKANSKIEVKKAAALEPLALPTYWFKPVMASMPLLQHPAHAHALKTFTQERLESFGMTPVL